MIIKDQVIFQMSKNNLPVVKVKSGEMITLHTKDCFNNQLVSESQKVDSLDWEHINPATGPIFIEQAMPNDTLKITIHSIEVEDCGTMAAIPENGVLGKYVTESQIKRIPIVEQKAIFSDSIQIPITPMIGVIGVAPKEGSIPCGEPGSHGGNMDNTKIAAGATLYLPIYHEGALLSLGDVHACMGDGEIMVTGVEIPATITLTVEILPKVTIQNPMLEDNDYCYTIASDSNIEMAIEMATYDMVNVVMQRLGFSFNEAGMFLSAVGNLEFCQVVDPKRTVRMKVSKKYMNSLF